jgi:lysophospholipase L1-like esterase
MTSVEDWQDLRDALDRINDEIWRLRAGQPTIIRVLGSFNPWFGQLQQAGVASVCMANEGVRDQVERDAAEAAGAVFVSWLDLFNGPAHDVDPVEQGWLADGVHPNDTGRALMVEALSVTGWEASKPPG